MAKLKKGMRLLLELEVHDTLEKVQIAEREKFSLITSRNKETIAEDCVKLGIKEFVRIHNLKISL